MPGKQEVEHYLMFNFLCSCSSTSLESSLFNIFKNLQMTTKYLALASICYSFSSLRFSGDHWISQFNIASFLQSLQTCRPYNFPSGFCSVSSSKWFWRTLGIEPCLDSHSWSCSDSRTMGPQLGRDSHAFWFLFNCWGQPSLSIPPSSQPQGSFLAHLSLSM